MVSAVDPKGKIVYRGTSSAGSTHHSQHHHRSVTKAVPEGALSAKKTTEIAAMFSNIKLNQTTDIVIGTFDIDMNTLSHIIFLFFLSEHLLLLIRTKSYNFHKLHMMDIILLLVYTYVINIIIITSDRHAKRIGQCAYLKTA